MTFVQITTAPGLTADQYDAIMQAAHGGALSDGEIFHVAGGGGERGTSSTAGSRASNASRAC
jgi:hypothetical protein